MSTSDAFVKIFLAILSIISALISVYVIPYLKSRKYWNEFGIFNDFVTDMVRAANQIYTPEENEAKKEYVFNLVNDYLTNNTSLGLNESQIDAIIEGIVREVKALDVCLKPVSNVQ